MKPHEETWELSPGVEVDVYDLYAVGEATAIKDIPQRVAPLVVAAPEMARRLLTHGSLVTTESGTEWHTLDCIEYGHNEECDADRSALTKAGIL